MEALDLAAQRKAAMDERMATRRAELERQREARKEGEDHSTRELVLAFESAFADGLGKASCSLEAAADVADVGAVSAAVQGLHQEVAAASTFLPAQTLERATRNLAELEAAIRARREQIAPKKKFAFKARDKLAPALPAATPGAGAAEAAIALVEAAPPPPPRPPGHDGAEVRGRRRERITVAPPRGSGGDMALSDLVDCDITLSDGVQALWIDKLVNCRVVSMCIAGGAHITGCVGCVFDVASRQIRIHQTSACDFYLHAGSHPIIEVGPGQGRGGGPHAAAQPRSRERATRRARARLPALSRGSPNQAPPVPRDTRRRAPACASRPTAKRRRYRTSRTPPRACRRRTTCGTSSTISTGCARSSRLIGPSCQRPSANRTPSRGRRSRRARRAMAQSEPSGALRVRACEPPFSLILKSKFNFQVQTSTPYMYFKSLLIS
jgi:hypothetical protein